MERNGKSGKDVLKLFEKYFLQYEKKELCALLYGVTVLFYDLWNINDLKEERQNELLQKGDEYLMFLDALVFRPETLPEKINIIISDE